MNPDRFFDEENSLYTEKPEFNEAIDNVLYSKKRKKYIALFCIFVLATFGGCYGIFGLSYEDEIQHSANIAAGCVFLLISLICVILFVLTYFSPLIIKKVRNHTVCVYTGVFKKKLVSIDNLIVYKGRENPIEIYHDNFELTVVYTKNKISLR